MLVSPEIDLASLSDPEFKHVVDTYLRGEVDETTVQALRGPLLERVIDTLDTMVRSVQVQLEAREAEIEEAQARMRLGQVTQETGDELIANAAKWRASAIRFRGRLEDAVHDHQRLPRQTRIQELEQAIASHRNARLGSASDADLRLWAVLGK